MVNLSEFCVLVSILPRNAAIFSSPEPKAHKVSL